MPRKMPIGVDIFHKLVAPENDYLYVDKSLWIKEVIEDISEVILLTRPRRWGKTLNLSMLQHFFASQVIGQPTQGMFDGLQIAQVDDGRYMEHQGRYPVIFISLKGIKESDFNAAINKIRLLIQELYLEHDYLLEHLSGARKVKFENACNGRFGQQELEISLKFLTQLLYEHYKQPVYILIDEYDSPFVHASLHGYLEQLTDFFKPFFSEALKTNPYLKKGIMTGILRIAKENMLSDLNNLRVYTLFNKRHQHYFGFTEAEVDGLFQATELNHDVARVKQLYNGYNIGEIVVYNPWSIVNCIDNEGELRPYWVNTASDGLLKTALLNQAATADIKIKFEQLIAGNAIDGIVNERVSFEDVERGDESAIWSLLLFSGYLKAVAVEPRRTHYRCQLAIPNEEVAMLYNDVFSDWLVQRSNQASYDRLLSSLVQGDVEAFTQGIYDFLLESSSSYDYGRQPEAFYQGFMLALTAGLTVTHIVESNPESGHGRPDILYIPKDPRQHVAIILEFKQADVSLKQTVDKMAQVALAQIKANAYEAKLRQHGNIQQVLKVGLGFAKKSVCAAYVVEPIGQGLDLVPNVTLTPVYGDKVDEKAVLQAVQQSIRTKRLASERLAEEAAEEEARAALMLEEDVAAAASTSSAASVTAAVKRGRIVDEASASASSSSAASVAQTPASLFVGNVPLVQQKSMAMDTSEQGQNPSP